MNEDVMNLIGVGLICLVAIYQMTKMPGSNRKYIIITVIGFAIVMIGGFILKYQLDTSRSVRVPIVLGGLVITMVALYKNYTHRKSWERKEMKKPRSKRKI